MLGGEATAMEMPKIRFRWLQIICLPHNFRFSPPHFTMEFDFNTPDRSQSTSQAEVDTTSFVDVDFALDPSLDSSILN